MIQVLLASLIFSAFSWSAFAGSNPPIPVGPVCSTQDANVCARLLFLTPISGNNEGLFFTDIFTPQDKEIRDFKIDLWMQMSPPGNGHGSRPLIVKVIDPNHFKVSNAWFMMDGEWQIRIHFNLENTAHEIILPVSVLSKLTP